MRAFRSDRINFLEKTLLYVLHGRPVLRPNVSSSQICDHNDGDLCSYELQLSCAFTRYRLFDGCRPSLRPVFIVSAIVFDRSLGLTSRFNDRENILIIQFNLIYF